MAYLDSVGTSRITNKRASISFSLTTMTSQINSASGAQLSAQGSTSPAFGGIHVNTIMAIQALLRATADAAGFDATTVGMVQVMLTAMASVGQAIQSSAPQVSQGAADAAPASPGSPPATGTAGAPPNTFRTSAPWIVGALYLVVPPQHLTAIPEQQLSVSEEEPPLWYCITKGKYVGVTLNHPLALAAIVGVSGGRMKSYKSQTLALQSFNDLLDYQMVTVVV
ncbi:hypothetical protein R3P38DRAFT_3369300 [Favolaschia claudopus]|uniref:Uncharacterized protein n=1 Tax=Favolaschia claudopus TaxID=2862362 RepID=A0AAW0A367_9AGAR